MSVGRDSGGESGQAVVMAKERGRDVVVATDAALERPDEPRMSRRRAIGGMSAVATAAAAAWAVPEILMAKPADGAVLSGTTGPSTLGTSTPGTSTSASPATSGSTTATSGPPVTLAQALAETGLDLQRDAEIGAVLIAGGWVMQHWASHPSTARENSAPRSASDT
jgi:hypothetical protein